MFEIIPSIWVINGKCVRVRQGDFATEELISDNPLGVAQEFEDCGIERLHLVDLDGARRGSPKNYHVLHTIAAYTSLKVDFTGGVATDGDVIKVFEHGAHTLTASTIAVRSPEKFAQWLISYGREKINMAADTDPADNLVKIRGWQKEADVDLFEHIEHFYERGLRYLKCSDTTREGVMEGPNFKLYKEIIERFPNLSLVASGGVRDIDDFRKLRDLGLFGVVFGKAFYDGRINAEEIKDFVASCKSMS
ncbi:1-(5-phosphoribosyl)-5-[(5-phosphoribosylamino)methylideneamino]imidazole-4-carboxamide isomerase [Echinicola pacifica]|nr:1-(5-phosphoribosyl)-5-[(5-phosphoribosylamino)methylideneamino] imidazole-4-carboxamide isomerase [Echinicola pacifica]